MIVERPTSVWTAVGAATLAEIAARHWRTWPQGFALHALSDRALAIANARALARSEGIGHVVELELRPERYAQIAERPLEPGELEYVLTAAIMNSVEYRGAVGDAELVRA